MPAHFDLNPIKVTGAVTLNTGGTASITSAAVDTLDNGVKYNRVIIVGLTGTVASGGNLTVLKLQSSSTSGGSYVDVPGGTATDLITDADDDKYFMIDVDLNKAGADRYLKVVATTGAAANCPIVYITAYLTEGQSVPATGSQTASLTSA